MSDNQEPKRLSAFLAEYYGADFVHELNMDIVRDNYDCAENILGNPKRFRNADFDRCQQLLNELDLEFPGQI